MPIGGRASLCAAMPSLVALRAVAGQQYRATGLLLRAVQAGGAELAALRALVGTRSRLQIDGFAVGCLDGALRDFGGRVGWAKTVCRIRWR